MNIGRVTGSSLAKTSVNEPTEGEVSGSKKAFQRKQGESEGISKTADEVLVGKTTEFRNFIQNNIERQSKVINSSGNWKDMYLRGFSREEEAKSHNKKDI